MPMPDRIFSPASPNRVSRIAAMTVARQPMRRRRASLIPLVSAMNKGARPGGSMTTNSVTKAVMMADSSMPPYGPARALCQAALHVLVHRG